MRLPPLVLRSGDREELECRVRCATVQARAAERARLVLMAADGASGIPWVLGGLTCGLVAAAVVAMVMGL